VREHVVDRPAHVVTHGVAELVASGRSASSSARTKQSTKLAEVAHVAVSRVHSQDGRLVPPHVVE
jgi:hypothetical protein